MNAQPRTIIPLTLPRSRAEAATRNPLQGYHVLNGNEQDLKAARVRQLFQTAEPGCSAIHASIGLLLMALLFIKVLLQPIQGTNLQRSKQR